MKEINDPEESRVPILTSFFSTICLVPASASNMKLLKFNQSKNQQRTHKYECVLSLRKKM